MMISLGSPVSSHNDMVHNLLRHHLFIGLKKGILFIIRRHHHDNLFASIENPPQMSELSKVPIELPPDFIVGFLYHKVIRFPKSLLKTDTV